MTKTAKLYTIGYEGMAIDAFLHRLTQIGVETIVDVRELPLSRKKGFSKTAFAAALQTAGIAYIHRPTLGCPKPIRDAYRADGDWSAYMSKFLAYLDTQGAAVAEVAKIARATSACLLCFEADFDRCHRSMVARAAAHVGGPSVVHLTARTAIPEAPAMAAA